MSKAKSAIPSEYFAKSPQGLWVKAELSDEEISVYWQPRYITKNGKLCVIDANGEIEKEVPVAQGRYDEPYRLAGAIPLTDDMVLFSGLPRFNNFLFGIMRHVVHLIVNGWGDTPEEVVDLFKEWNDDFYIINGSYMVVNTEMDPFVGFRNVEFKVKHDEDGSMQAKMRFGEQDFEFPIEGREMMTAFFISTIPLP